MPFCAVFGCSNSNKKDELDSPELPERTIFGFEESWLTASSYETMMQDVDLSRCCNSLLILPKAGEIYMYSKQTLQNCWYNDGFDWGKRNEQEFPKGIQVECSVYRRVDDPNFLKMELFSIDFKEGEGYVLIHYIARSESCIVEVKSDNVRNIVPGNDICQVEEYDMVESQNHFTKPMFTTGNFGKKKEPQKEKKGVYTSSSTWLTTANYFKILKSVDLERCLNKPLVKPDAGDIYVYKNDKCTQDWRADQYPWRCTGVRRIPPSSPVMVCRYFRTFGGEGFFKRAFSLIENNDCVLIHYVGSTEGIVSQPHGNRKKHTEIKFITTAKSQIDHQRLQVKLNPSEAYRNLAISNVEPARAPVLLPRDGTQVRNTIANERRKRLINTDDIIGIYMLGEELRNFVNKLELLPIFCSMLVSSESIRLFKMASKEEGCHMFYDTTFNLGDFYVSVLSYKNPIVENKDGVHPIIPLMCMIHHERKSEVHSSFFTWAKEICPLINGVTIITDREQAIVLNVREKLDKSQHFFCWNHIQQDIKNWLRKRPDVTGEEISVYVSHVWNLLESGSKEEFKQIYQKMSQNWSKDFDLYFKKDVYEDALKSSKGELEKCNIYIKGSGITINAAESFNAVLKRCTGKKELPAQTLVLCLYHLDLHYQREIIKANCNLGNYVLAPPFQNLRKDPSDVLLPQTHLPLDKLPNILLDWEFPQIPEKDFTDVTPLGLAKMLVLEGNVELVSKKQVFIVSGLTSDYMVRLFPEEQCTCKARRNCTHISAAKLSIGKLEGKSKKVKLTKLMKRRVTSRRLGRKQPEEIVTLVKAADDSFVHGKGIENTFLIPTVSKKGLIKKKFAHIEFEVSHTADRDTDTPIEKSKIDVDNTTYNENEFRLLPTSTPEISKSEIYPNFDEDFRNNKPMSVDGIPIYPKDLECLDLNSDHGVDAWLSDTIIEVYLRVLYLSEKNYNEAMSVNVFTGEAFVLSNLNMTSVFKNGLVYFISNKVTEADIVIMPIVCDDHCRLIVAIRKLKCIIYLDSLHSSSTECTTFFLDLYATALKVRGLKFELKKWKIYYPNDIPRQRNSTDCGVFSCLFAETIIKRNTECLQQYIRENSLDFYRALVKERLINYMRKKTKPLTKEVKIKNLNLDNEKRHLKDILPLIRHESPSTKQDTLQFLSTIIDNYWDEKSNCAYKEKCLQKGGNMILCEACCHWVHSTCEEINVSSVPGIYICKRCALEGY